MLLSPLQAGLWLGFPCFSCPCRSVAVADQKLAKTTGQNWWFYHLLKQSEHYVKQYSEDKAGNKGRNEREEEPEIPFLNIDVTRESSYKRNLRREDKDNPNEHDERPYD